MIINTEQIEMFIKGSIMGMLIGDAIGNAYQLSKDLPIEIDMTSQSSDYPPGTYTSFSALALCTMSSINDCEEINLSDILDKFNDLLLASYLSARKNCVELGPVMTQAITRHTNGIPPDRCGIWELEDNECMSRILPISLYCSNNSISDFINISHQVCQITHSHPKSQICCTLYALIIRNLLLQKAEKIFDVLATYYKDKDLEEYGTELQTIKQWKTDNKCSGTNNIIDCFWSVWSSYSNNQGYRFVVDSAIRLRNNSCVTAAMSGSIAALSGGLNDIPYRWLHTVLMSSEVMEVIEKFTQNVIRRLK